MPPDTLSPETRELARRLVATTPRNSQHHAVVQFTEQLRGALTRFAGADSFASLLRRSLVLASAEVPTLAKVRVSADGQLHELKALAEDTSDQDEGAEDAAAVAIASNLLGLLITFVGKPFTYSLVRDAWPDLSPETHQSRTEDEA